MVYTTCIYHHFKSIVLPLSLIVLSVPSLSLLGPPICDMNRAHLSKVFNAARKEPPIVRASAASHVGDLTVLVTEPQF